MRRSPERAHALVRNPTIQGFDLTKPAILVHERHHHRWQLAALEWVFPTTPTTPPLPGATYGSFGAACHYIKPFNHS